MTERFGDSPGKTKFTEAYLEEHGEGNEESINEAWSAAGNEGTISSSLVYKMRAKLGLTGHGRAGAKKPRQKPKPSKLGRTINWTASSFPSSTGSTKSTGETHETTSSDPHLELDELEDGIDVLIQRIKDHGGLTEVERALRHARRFLVRSHEG